MTAEDVKFLDEVSGCIIKKLDMYRSERFTLTFSGTAVYMR
jgi:hypothetical protein